MSDQQAAQGATDVMLAWQLRKEAGIQVDIIVVAESEFKLGTSVINTLAYEVAQEVILLMENQKK